MKNTFLKIFCFIVCSIVLNNFSAQTFEEERINDDSLISLMQNGDLEAYKEYIEFYAKKNTNLANQKIDDYLKNAELLDDKYHMSNAYFLKGYLLSEDEHLYEGKRFLEKAITLRLEYATPREISICLNQLGIVEQQLGDIELAQKYYFEAYDVAESSDIQDVIGMVEMNIANMFTEIEDYSTAKEYVLRSIHIFRLVDDKKSEASAYNILGNIYQQFNKPDTAKLFYRESFNLYKEIGDNSGLAHVSNNLAIISFFENDLKGALHNFRQALEYRKKVGDKINLAQSLNNMAIYYQLTEVYDSALFYNNQSIILAQEVGALIELRDAYQTSEEIYESLNKSDSALAYFKNYVKIKDSIVSKEALKNIQEVEAKYESERQRKELALSNVKLKKQKLQTELERASASFQLYLFLGVILFLVAIGALIYRGYQQKKKNNILLKKQHNEIKEKNKEISFQHKQLQVVNAEIEEKNKDITSSITYAKHIQNAMLPTIEEMKEIGEDFGLLFKPRDIVSGDFYWSLKEGDYYFVAVADCTGHGVPGAMVSVVCANALNKVVNEEKIIEPGEILARTAEIIADTFTKGGTTLRDGMDISLVRIKKDNSGEVEVAYAGANNPVYLVHDNELSLNEDWVKSVAQENNNFLYEMIVNRQPVGKYDGISSFDTYHLKLPNEVKIYLFSDGYADQFGGEKGKKFKYSKFKEMILNNCSMELEKQIEVFERTFIEWKSDFEQIDDVCVIGVRV